MSACEGQFQGRKDQAVGCFFISYFIVIRIRIRNLVENEGDLLVGELAVDGGVSGGAGLNVGLILGVEVDLDDALAVDLAADDGLLAGTAVDLLGGGDEEVLEGPLKVVGGHLEVEDLLGDLELELVGAAAGLANLTGHCCVK